MAVRKVLVYPHPILRKPTRPVETLNDEILELARDLVDTMKAYEGLGLSANQIGKLWSMFALDLEALEVGEGTQVFVNPRIVYREGSYVDEEGCLSFPELYIDVERAKFVILQAKIIKDGELVDVELSANDLFARAIQHELDHLQGILFIDHLPLEVRTKILRDWMERFKQKQPS